MTLNAARNAMHLRRFLLSMALAAAFLACFLAAALLFLRA